MAAATSSAVTSRPIGWRAFSAARSASGSSAASTRRATQGVSAVPGFTQFTRMPSPMWSAAMARVRDCTAPLVAEYSARCGRPAVAAIEQVLTTAAFDDARRYGRAARVTRTRPTTFTSNTRCHCSSGLSSTVPDAPMPALLTKTSIPPSTCAAASTAARTEASPDTSAVNPYSPAATAGDGSRSRTDDRVRGLHEHHGSVGDGRAGLLGVVPVVQPDAHHLAGVGDRRAEPLPGDLEFGEKAGSQGVPCGGDAALGEEPAVDVRCHRAQIEGAAGVVEERRGLLSRRAET